MPRRLDYVSDTYALLKKELESTHSGVYAAPCLYGYSIYEFDGAFLDDNGKIMEDRTLAIRVFFNKKDLEMPARDASGGEFDVTSLERKVIDIMNRLAKISKSVEKEIWTFRYDAHVYKLIKV